MIISQDKTKEIKATCTKESSTRHQLVGIFIILIFHPSTEEVHPLPVVIPDNLRTPFPVTLLPHEHAFQEDSDFRVGLRCQTRLRCFYIGRSYFELGQCHRRINLPSKSFSPLSPHLSRQPILLCPLNGCRVLRPGFPPHRS